MGRFVRLSPRSRGELVLVVAIATAMLFAVAFPITLLARSQLVNRLENGIFAAFTASVLEDGDLNPINQVYPEQRWLVSRTYNFADVRDIGGVALWLPFNAYARLLPTLRLAPRLWGTPVTHDDAAQAVGTLFLTLLSV